MDNPSITITGPGIDPIHTDLDTIKRANERVAQIPESGRRFAEGQLKSIIERVERMEEEKKTITDDIRDIYAEAKGNGFDVAALKTIVRMRKKDPNERQEAETILETYMLALGML